MRSSVLYHIYQKMSKGITIYFIIFKRILPKNMLVSGKR